MIPCFPAPPAVRATVATFNMDAMLAPARRDAQRQAATKPGRWWSLYLDGTAEEATWWPRPTVEGHEACCRVGAEIAVDPRAFIAGQGRP